MAKALMIQGTSSGAGKSVTVAGLCRIFRQDGYSVAPFKSQNMALNSFVTPDGLEIGRAQAVQAEAAGLEPSVLMNPILLKPTGDAVSQVIVNGEVAATLSAAEYYRRKAAMIPVVREAYQALAGRHDVVVIEGAGSPAEINLNDNDIVNMGMAAIADAPVLLVGDIDRGGVFASLYGTVQLLDPGDRGRVKGVVINKFRGDIEILRPGLVSLERLIGVPVAGVVPWLRVDIDDEDSLSPRLGAGASGKPVDVAVVRLPRLANFTDFNALARHPQIGVRYVERAGDLGFPDLLVLPGTKNTMADLVWMRQNGMEAVVKRLAGAGVPVIGICGGYQMLGLTLDDPDEVEGGGSLRGMELLPVRTVFATRKVRTRTAGTVGEVDGFFAPLSGAAFSGYEIHMGDSAPVGDVRRFAVIDSGGDGVVAGNVLGTYVHGLFDDGEIARRLAGALLARKGAAEAVVTPVDHRAYKESQYDALASALRSALDMKLVYGIMGLEAR